MRLIDADELLREAEYDKAFAGNLAGVSDLRLLVETLSTYTPTNCGSFATLKKVN